MALLTRPRNRTNGLGSFYKGDTYAPNNIGTWVATDDRDMPWNTIGKALGNSKGEGEIVDGLMTAADVLAATDLDIEVRKVPLQVAGTDHVLPNVFVTGYDDPDTGDLVTFGAVSDRYTVVQPRDTLAFFDEVVAGIEGAAYSAAWNMREKSMMGLTIHLPNEVVVDPKGANDRTALHLLGVNSFDGSTGVSGAMVGTRWWCMNQMTPRIRGGARRFSFRHTAKVHSRAAEAARMIEVVDQYSKSLDVMANGLYSVDMTDAQFERFLSRIPIFDLSKGDTELTKGRITERREEAIAAWRAPHNENITGTRWGALNVVAEYVEWGRKVKGSSRTGTDATRQRAIGTMVSPHVTQPVDMALQILESMR